MDHMQRLLELKVEWFDLFRAEQLLRVKREQVMVQIQKLERDLQQPQQTKKVEAA